MYLPIPGAQEEQLKMLMRLAGEKVKPSSFVEHPEAGPAGHVTASEFSTHKTVKDRLWPSLEPIFFHGPDLTHFFTGGRGAEGTDRQADAPGGRESQPLLGGATRGGGVRSRDHV